MEHADLSEASFHLYMNFSKFESNRDGLQRYVLSTNVLST